MRPFYSCVLAIVAYNASMTTPSRPGASIENSGQFQVDYVLAKRRVLRDYRRGMLTILDVCDAHPELLRVAENFGIKTNRDCPICADADKRSALYEVNYLYGDGLKKNGRPVTEHNQISDADKSGKAYHRYLVEVCTDCKWNFLIKREDRGE